jgi:hypothetical protein
MSAELVKRNECCSMLDREIVNLPSMTDACNESGKLPKRDSSPVTTVSDHRVKEQQCGECRRKVTLTSVGRMFLDDPLLYCPLR